MPVRLKHNEKGYYYQYGNHGTKYYFVTNRGRIIALNKAIKQAKAIHASKSAQAKKKQAGDNSSAT